MAYQYKIQHHKEAVLASSEKVAQSYEMIRRLSKDFTQDNDTAIQLDNAVYANLKFGNKIPEPKSEREERTTKKENTSGAPDKLVSSVKALLNKNVSGRVGKVSFDDLDKELQKKLGTAQVIQYQVPNQPLGPKIAKSNIPAFQKIVDDVVLGQNVFLVGGAGTGKTTLAQNVTTALGREYMTINCSQWTAPIEIIGGQTLDGYQEGKLIEAWKNGYILILDELPKIDPNTAGLFNDALAKSKIPNSLIFNSRKESFAKHPNFAVIATGNIWPNAESMSYGANNKQDLSLLDRFAGSVYTIEKNFELEKQVIGSDLLWTWCGELRHIIEQLKYDAQISMRFMMTCRDTLVMEIKRINSSTGVDPDEGKTLADCFESFMESNFTEVQRKTITDKWGKSNWGGHRYSVISEREYRTGVFFNTLTSQLANSGYLKSDGLNGLGSFTDTGFRRYWDGE